MVEKNICINCITRTGGCCTDMNLLVDESEAGPFLEAKEKNLLPKNHSFEKLETRKEIFLYQSRGERCMFLSNENTCSIYDKRPSICKLYPIVWKRTSLDPINIYADMLCPLTHAIPIVKLYEQTKKEENQILMKKIGPLDFNDIDYSYLNITEKKDSSSALHDLYEE